MEGFALTNTFFLGGKIKRWEMEGSVTWWWGDDYRDVSNLLDSFPFQPIPTKHFVIRYH